MLGYEKVLLEVKNDNIDQSQDIKVIKGRYEDGKKKRFEPQKERTN